MIFTDFLLEGEARTWWKMEKRKLGVDKVNWENFQKVFLEHYFPGNVCDQMEQDFLLLKQGDMTVAQYDAEFHRLAHFGPSLVTTEKDRAKKFINGLKLTIQKDLAICNIETYYEALDKSLRIERSQNQLDQYQESERKKRKLYSQKDGQRHNADGRGNRQQTQHQQLEMKCPRCGRNHLLKDCWIELGVCFKCKQKGHVAANCPKKNQQQQTQGRVFALATRNGETSNVKENQEQDM